VSFEIDMRTTLGALLGPITLLLGCSPQRDSTSPQSVSNHTSPASSNLAARLDFGLIALGTPIRSLPQGAQFEHKCNANQLLGCTFELDSVRYETSWEDNIVVMKTIIVDEGTRDRLPFGLTGDETIEAALVHLNEMFTGIFTVGRNETGEAFLIARSARSDIDMIEISLRFAPGGRLREIRAACCFN